MKNIVKELRESNKLSQEELGRILGVSRQTIISIEKGKYSPSLELAFKLSTYFGLCVEEIFNI